MIRILHVTNVLGRAGATRSAAAIAKHLRALGSFDETFVSLEPWEEGAAALVEAAGMRALNAPPADVLRDELECADIVHVEWGNSASIGEFLRGPLPPLRLLLFFHVAGDAVPNVITRKLVDFADFCVACCPYTYEHSVLQALPVETQAARAAVVWATADFSRLQGLRRRAHRGFNVGYIGKADFRKMHPDFVAMSARVDVPEVRFLVCGRGHVDLLRQQAAQLGAADRFEFRGHVEDIRPVLAALDVYGYPVAENVGAELNLQEAMYAGIPAVVFGRGGIRDLVLPELTGLVVRTPAEYVEAIEYLYHHPEERRRLGRNARAVASQIFGGERSARKLETIYRNLMRSPKRDRRWPAWDGASGVAPSGAVWLAESLGDYGTPFAASLAGGDLDRILAAEAEIAALSRFGLWCIQSYRARYPEDGHLALWAGLTLQQLGEDEEACAALQAAWRCGVTHWRVSWYLARSAAALGERELVERHCAQVLEQAPDFAPARELLLGSRP
jgi:glycosyltransferase involved in cell wall biosynthesis